MKFLFPFIFCAVAILVTTDRVSSQTSAQLRFLQMERSLNKFWIPIAKRKVPTRDEWYMEYGPISTLLDSLEFYPTNLYFSPKDSLSVKLNSSTGTDVNFVEGSGIYLNRIDSFNLEIANVQSHYTQLSGVNPTPGLTEVVQLLPIATNTKIAFNTLQDNGFSTTGSLGTNSIFIDEDGTYRISFATTIRISPANEQISVYLIKNGVRISQAYRYLDHPTLESLVVSFSYIAELSVGDDIHVYMRYSNPTPTSTVIGVALALPSLSLQRIK